MVVQNRLLARFLPLLNDLLQAMGAIERINQTRISQKQISQRRRGAMLDLWTKPMRRFAGLSLILACAWQATAAAQTEGLNVRDRSSAPPAETLMESPVEDITQGATIVRGRYAEAGSETEWEAAVRNGQPERIVEWRSFNEGGTANTIFNFYNGALMHYAERSQRRNAAAGPAGELVNVELDLSFQQGRYSHGSKVINGRVMEPSDTDIRIATEHAQAAMQRVSVTRSAWSERQGSAFSLVQIPEPSGPSADTRRLAGDGDQIVFRCQEESLFAILGSADTLVVAPPGKDPVVLARQPRGSRYDYLGNGWGAARRGDELSGRAIFCRRGN
jgi:hypothetical protein